MSSPGFADRFRRLEIPDDKRRADWSFLEAALDLPRPLPLEEEPILILASGRAFVAAEAAPSGPAIWLYDRAHALVPVDAPSKQETRWRETNAKTLEKVKKRFFGTIPPSVLTEPALVRDALSLLDVEKDASAFARLVGESRLLRLHGKLYDLKTLQEYSSTFARAIEPDFYRKLQALPATVAPEELLALIERSLDQVHAKARSPLRNKLLSTRVVLDGITLLPIYREPAAALFEALGSRLERVLKAEVLVSRA
jgi:hypothetical protein